MVELTQEQTIAIRKTVLKEFHKICEKNGIKYSLGYGTLLGAVRHEDMIPWDDDIDVILLREDFEKLCSLFQSSNCHDKYQFVSHRNHPEIKTKIGYYIDYSTITETAYKTNDYHGVHIDVYPVDVIPNNVIEKNILLIKRRFLHLLIRAKDVHPSVVHGFQRFIRLMVLALLTPVSYDKALDKLQQVSMRYSNLPDNERVTACILVETGRPLFFSYSLFDSYDKYTYDNFSFWGVKDYDSLLKAWYGDYMTPPPFEERVRPDHKYVHFYLKDEY